MTIKKFMLGIYNVKEKLHGKSEDDSMGYQHAMRLYQSVMIPMLDGKLRTAQKETQKRKEYAG